MAELFDAAFSGVNVIYTTLLGLVLIYWSIVILGVIDLDAFDMDMDVDADIGGDFDADASMDTGGEGGFSWLSFFNMGEVPIMFFVSIVVLTMWIVSMQINGWLDDYATGWVKDYRNWVSLGLIIPNLIFAMFVAKFLMVPIKQLNKRRVHHTNLIGKTCLVTSLEVTDKFGRCEMPKEEGSLILNVRSEGSEVLRKGDAAEIIEHVKEGNYDVYVVTKKSWNEPAKA